MQFSINSNRRPAGPCTKPARRLLPWLVGLGAAAAHGQTPPPATPQTPPPAASAQTPPPPAPAKDFDVSGYADLYFQYDFGQRHGNQPVSGRWYDTTQGDYRISAVEVDVSRAPTAKQPFGFFLGLLVGPNATTLASTEPGGINTYKDFSQAYVTYQLPTKYPFTLDFGKWYAFVGYEGLDSRTQDNYSRSFTFTSLEPDYMTGLRATVNPNSKLTLNGYAYAGYNEVKDSNSSPTVGAGATYAFSDKLTATLQGYYGKEGSTTMNQSGSFGGIGFPTAGPSWVAQSNLVVVYQASPKDKFAFDGTQANATGKGTWIGGAVYYRRTQDSHNAFCFRVERADDTDGLRFLAGPLLLHSFTATYDYSVNKNLTLRFEVRHDISDNPFFNSDSGLTTQRTTLTFAQIIKF